MLVSFVGVFTALGVDELLKRNHATADWKRWQRALTSFFVALAVVFIYVLIATHRFA